ncbi:hypothetical protein [Aliagarivorans marinus]|uniref:hypothetical protein n=1 Tax=Aliagarivorans marinus TaxID=561965 RepID=UPI0003F8D124|nr:hypothetical protein [Aliagarivorans marinus]
MEITTLLLEQINQSGAIPKKLRKQVKLASSDKKNIIQELENLTPSFFDKLPTASQEYLKDMLYLESHHNSKWERFTPELSTALKVCNKLLGKKISSKIAPHIWGSIRKLNQNKRKALRIIRFHTPFMRFEDLLQVIKFNPLILQSPFCKGIATNKAIDSFWEYGNSESGYILGIDIINSNGDFYVIECNVSPAILSDRKVAFLKEPIAEGISEILESGEFCNIDIFMPWLTSVDSWFLEEMQQKCDEKNISLNIFEDPRRNLSINSQKYPSKRTQSKNSISFDMREHEAGQSFLLNNKHSFLSILLEEKKNNKNYKYSVAPMSSTPQEDWFNKTSNSLPNIVIKEPSEDKGENVHFIKANSPDDAIRKAEAIVKDTEGYVYQPFITSNLVDEEYVYDIRSYLIITPSSVVFSKAFSRVSGTPIAPPRKNEENIDRKSFMSNTSLGGRIVKLPQYEIDNIREVTIDVGKALQSALGSSFTIS